MTDGLMTCDVRRASKKLQNFWRQAKDGTTVRVVKKYLDKGPTEQSVKAIRLYSLFLLIY